MSEKHFGYILLISSIAVIYIDYAVISLHSWIMWVGGMFFGLGLYVLGKNPGGM